MMDQADDQEDDSLPPWDPLGEAAAGIEFETAVRDYRMSQALVQALDDHCEALEQFAVVAMALRRMDACAWATGLARAACVGPTEATDASAVEA
jgi:hypothetical protein